MSNIDKLIKSLQEAKAELEKSMNIAPGSASTNVTKQEIEKADTVRPDKGFGSVTVKDTTPKPANPAKPFGSVILKDEDMEKDAANPALAPKQVKVKQLQAQIDAGTYKPDSAKIAGAMVKEELSLSANGQWNLNKAAPKLTSHSADKEIKADWTKQAHKPVFEMSHVDSVAAMKDHGNAKQFAHGIVDNSNAKDETKHKIKSVINSSKNPLHLASAMSNHILAHQGLNVIGSKK